MIDGDAVEAAIRVADLGFELLAKVSERVFVFGEDDDAAIIPGRVSLPELRAQIVPKPVEQLENPSVGPTCRTQRDRILA